MFAAALALAAAASWGVGDFFGGLKSRTLNPVAVLIVAQPIGLTLLGVWVAVRGQGPPGSAVLWACLAAVLGTTGLIAFYRGMAAGALSIVAPIAGAGATIPVIWGLAGGDRPSGSQEPGLASAKGLVSVVSILASLYPVVTVLLARAVLHERVHRSQELGIALALAGIVLISAG